MSNSGIILPPEVRWDEWPTLYQEDWEIYHDMMWRFENLYEANGVILYDRWFDRTWGYGGFYY